MNRSKEFQAQVLELINAQWNALPFIVLHGLYELTGALASALLVHEQARPHVILGLTELLGAHLQRDAAATVPKTEERRH